MGDAREPSETVNGDLANAEQANAEQANAEEATNWNGIGGRGWVEAQEIHDEMYKPFEDVLVEAVVAGGGHGPVLDVGCGTGGVTVAVAKALGGESRCVGVDISEPMIAAGRARAEGSDTAAEFVRADAQTYDFEPAVFAGVISRFGVMFFDDSDRAFGNLRRAAKDGADLRLIVWRALDENPFMTAPARAAEQLLPKLANHSPAGPGPFALANPDDVRRVLAGSGWTDVDIQPLDIPCALPESSFVRYLTLVGPLARALAAEDEPTRAKVLETVRPALDSYVHGTEVRFTAATWLISARAAQ